MRVRAVHSGTATLKDATSQAIRDWVTNVETTHYILGSVAGPHPYLMMVREFHAVIGKETRRQAMEKWGGKPDVLVACVGGGSNAMGLFHEFVDDADVRLIGVEAAGHGLDSGKHENKVSLFFTESPTNPFLRCIEIKFVSELCHSKGSLVCIDGTFASPINQKPLTLGADLLVHSATKFIAGHNDVIAGCISGSEELISKVRQYHHVVGGVLDPKAAYMISRGMKTLHLRVQYQNSIALRMAQGLMIHH